MYTSSTPIDRLIIVSVRGRSSGSPVPVLCNHDDDDLPRRDHRSKRSVFVSATRPPSTLNGEAPAHPPSRAIAVRVWPVLSLVTRPCRTLDVVQARILFESLGRLMPARQPLHRRPFARCSVSERQDSCRRTGRPPAAMHHHGVPFLPLAGPGPRVGRSSLACIHATHVCAFKSRVTKWNQFYDVLNEQPLVAPLTYSYSLPSSGKACSFSHLLLP